MPGSRPPRGGHVSKAIRRIFNTPDLTMAVLLDENIRKKYLPLPLLNSFLKKLQVLLKPL